MPHSDTGESVTPQLDLPSRDGLVVNAILVDYEPGGTRRALTGPGRRVRVRDRRQHDLRTRRPRTGRAEGRRVVLRAAGRAALRVAQRRQELPASLIAFFGLEAGQRATGYDPHYGRRRVFVVEQHDAVAADEGVGQRDRRPAGDAAPGTDVIAATDTGRWLVEATRADGRDRRRVVRSARWIVTRWARGGE